MRVAKTPFVDNVDEGCVLLVRAANLSSPELDSWRVDSVEFDPTLAEPTGLRTYALDGFIEAM